MPTWSEVKKAIGYNDRDAYEDIAAPFKTVGNRQVLTDEQIANEPWLAEFVECFKHCFERSEIGFCWIYSP